MNRKEFLKKTALAAVAVNSFSISDIFAARLASIFEAAAISENTIAPVSPEVDAGFLAVLEWLTENGWEAFFKRELNIDLMKDGKPNTSELIDKDIPDHILAALKIPTAGFDDFAGKALIKPGSPALSLLYHALASPRVQPPMVKAYPLIKHIDALENYIYALKKWEHYPYKPEDKLVLAVFAYEYRPAAKTPHQAHADLVYSRTGISRLGNKRINYDAQNRLFTNKPREEDDASGKNIAVTAARYGLFLAKVVDQTSLSILKSTGHKGQGEKRDEFDNKKDDENTFLLPLRKIFDNDLLFNNCKIKFRENHSSEKLSVLLKKSELKRTSDTLIETSDTLIEKKKILPDAGSSFLVASKAQELIRELKGFSFEVNPSYKNRYFTSYSKKSNDNEGFFIETISDDGSYREPNSYKAGREEPMYVHIAHRIKKDGSIEQIPRTELNVSTRSQRSFEDIIYEEHYFAPVYEDGICDGAVSADISELKSDSLKDVLAKGVTPAFSIITAPDFLPFVDLFDIKDFDVAPGASKESNFFEGGVASLATARIRPNPQTVDPVNSSITAFKSSTNKDPLFNTLTAVVTQVEQTGQTRKKDFLFSSFLPDSCSSVFAPGWDVTYAGTKGTAYLSTRGLGSPFIEDMKLCAAMNGMWAVASPDTARVFQGTITKDDSEWYANPTAIPLLDNELGFHPSSPASYEAKHKWPAGWDGEQGAFLQFYSNYWHVNFTDLGRADYVQNYLDNAFDMSVLRDLTTEELTSRMSALRVSIRKLKGKSVANNTLWLVSAEKSENKSFKGNGIPANLFGKTKDWATKMQFSSENCYLYVFAEIEKDRNWKRRLWAPGQTLNGVKRRLIACEKLYVCQVSDTSFKSCQAIHRGNVVSEITWED